jgi:hypothetical protein
LESGNLNKPVFPQEVSGGKARLRLSENAKTGFGVELACVMQSPGQDLASGLPQGVRPYVVQTGMGAGTRLKFEPRLHLKTINFQGRLGTNIRKRTSWIIEAISAGTSLHSRDPTAAAKRAVDDAIRHNSLTGLYGLLRQTQSKRKADDAILIDAASADSEPQQGTTVAWDRMRVFLTIACPLHEQVDLAEVAASLPHGHVVRTKTLVDV